MQLAFAKNQGQFVESFLADHGRKPNQREFNRWESVVKDAMSKVNAHSSSNDVVGSELAGYQDWHNESLSLEGRATYLQSIVKYVHGDSQSSPYWESMRTEAARDKDCSYVLSFHAGYLAATEEARRLHKLPRDLRRLSLHHKDCPNPAYRRGWDRCRAGKSIPAHAEIVKYLSNSYDSNNWL
jgi:hypothetical protein